MRLLFFAFLYFGVIMKKSHFLFFVLIMFAILSCKTKDVNKIVKETDSILSEAPDAIEAIIEILKEKKIVFVGEVSHRLLNEKLSIDTNLQRFYDAGVRYILAEGGIDDGPVYSDEWLLKKAIMLFYPWDYVGVRYGATDIRNNAYLINTGKQEAEKIKYIGLESGRQDSIPGTSNRAELYNYRDEYMANTAFEFIDNSRVEEKFLVVAGGAHGITEVVRNSFYFGSSWKPLGAYLKEKYEDNFVSLYYITLDEQLDRDSYKALFEINEWQDITNSPKYITKPEAKRFDKLLPISYEKGFDGYIVDKSSILGIMYSYALNDIEIFTEVVEQTKQCSNSILSLNNEGLLAYNDPEVYNSISTMLKNIYYLKLFYGDSFPYSFWNPQIRLAEALSILKNNILADGIITDDEINFPLPSMEIIRQYHENIEAFVSLAYYNISLNIFERLRLGSTKTIFERNEPHMRKAKELFPYELWTDYWYAKMYVELKEFEKAYNYIKIILDDPLIFSLFIYPEILDLAEQTVKNLGFYTEALDYMMQKEKLSNEFTIDVSYFTLILY
jgi:hypothetical protein